MNWVIVYRCSLPFGVQKRTKFLDLWSGLIILLGLSLTNIYSDSINVASSCVSSCSCLRASIWSSTFMLAPWTSTLLSWSPCVRVLSMVVLSMATCLLIRRFYSLGSYSFSLLNHLDNPKICISWLQLLFTMSISWTTKNMQNWIIF